MTRHVKNPCLEQALLCSPSDVALVADMTTLALALGQMTAYKLVNMYQVIVSIYQFGQWASPIVQGMVLSTACRLGRCMRNDEVASWLCELACSVYAEMLTFDKSSRPSSCRQPNLSLSDGAVHHRA